MHLLAEYTSFEIVLFFRLADKHNHNIDLVSAILRSHPLVTQEEGYNADRLSTPALVSLLRQLLEDDQRAQPEIKGAYRPNSVNASTARLTGVGADDDKTIRDAVERIWLKSWKRLSEDLIKSIQECEEKDKRLLNQIKTLDRDGHLPRPIAGAPPRNGVAASGPAQYPQDIKAPVKHVSPVTAPVPEVVKKPATPIPQPVSAIPPNREGVPPIRATQPQPAQLSHAPHAPPQPQQQPQKPLHGPQGPAQATPQQPQHPQHPQHPQQPRPPQPQQTQPQQTQPPHPPHPPHLLRPLQPSPVTARPNGAAQVLQAPPGVSQSLSQFAQPGRPASPATLSPKPPLDSVAKSGPPASLAHPQTSVQPPLKWEAPYQGPQHIPPHRPLQPNTARNTPQQPQPPQPTQHPQVFKRPAASVPPTQPPVQPASQPPVPTTQQPPSVPHGVLAPPQTGPQPASRPPQPLPKPPIEPVRSHPVTPVPPPRIPHGLFKAPATPVAKAKQPAPTQQPIQKAAAPLPPAQPITPAVAKPVYPSKQPLTVTPIPHPQFPHSQPPALQAKPEVVKRDAPPQTPLPPAAAPQTPIGEQSTILRNSAFATLQRKLNHRLSTSAPQSPKTPQATTPTTLKTGHSTKWVISSTPSTPRAHDLIVDTVQGPSYEPITSPIQKPAPPPSATPRTEKQKPSPKTVQKADASATKVRGRPRRSAQIARSATASSGPTRRSQSVASQVDELSMDHHDLVSKLKEEISTPRRASEDTGDTTADESVTSRRTVGFGSVSRANKRKRQDSEATPHSFPPPPLPPAPPLAGPPTHVHWTRGFQKVSASALDQIGSHRDANMFANQIRERDAPNYGGIVLQPQNIASIKKAITHGGRVALQTAQNLPGGDPGTPVVLLPLSEDLVPPKGIINSAQLERELVHMFCNAVMYNPDPHRGPGPAFLRSRHGRDGDDSLGYKMDEFGVVKSTRNMFLEVEKLLTDLRHAESQKGLPSASTVSLPVVKPGSTTPGPATSGSTAGGGAADDTADDMDELARDDTSNAGRRKRVKT